MSPLLLLVLLLLRMLRRGEEAIGRCWGCKNAVATQAEMAKGKRTLMVVGCGCRVEGWEREVCAREGGEA